MENIAKMNTSTNLGLPIDKENDRAFTGVHGVDQAMGEWFERLPDGDGRRQRRDRRHGSAPRKSWKRRRRGWRERGTGWNGGSGEDDPHPVPFNRLRNHLNPESSGAYPRVSARPSLWTAKPGVSVPPRPKLQNNFYGHVCLQEKHVYEIGDGLG
jgi:hypothetical protein